MEHHVEYVIYAKFYLLCLCIVIFLRESFKTIYLVSLSFHNHLVCGEVYFVLQCQIPFVDQSKLCMQTCFDLMLILFFQ